MRALFVAACFVMGVACSGRVEMVQDSEATASQGIAAGSTGGAANVFTLVQAIGAQSQFSLDGITESVSEFNGVLSVTVPAFQSGGMSGAIVYSSGHDILQLNGSTTPKHQGVAGRWNSNFFGRFVDIETRAQASEGPNLDGWNVGFLNPVSHGAYFVETAGGSRLSWLSRDVHLSTTAQYVSAPGRPLRRRKRRRGVAPGRLRCFVARRRANGIHSPGWKRMAIGSRGFLCHANSKP